MPLPLLFPLAAVATKFAVACKTAAVCGKGAAVATKVVGSKAALGKVAASSAHAYGVTHTIAYGTVAVLTLGSAATLYERGRWLSVAIRDGDSAAAIEAASSLARACAGKGGLEDARSLLEDYSVSGWRNVEVVQEVKRMLDSMLIALRLRLDG